VAVAVSVAVCVAVCVVTSVAGFVAVRVALFVLFIRNTPWGLVEGRQAFGCCSVRCIVCCTVC